MLVNGYRFCRQNWGLFMFFLSFFLFFFYKVSIKCDAYSRRALVWCNFIIDFSEGLNLKVNLSTGFIVDSDKDPLKIGIDVTCILNWASLCQEWFCYCLTLHLIKWFLSCPLNETHKVSVPINHFLQSLFYFC